MLDFDLFTRVVDEAGPSLGRIDFFNYGEAFLHKRAIEMCEYIKTKFPHIYLYTSTNGLAFTEEKARQLAHSGIDEVTFSIDGASQETYVRYRQRGKFDMAIANLRAMVDEKAKSGRDVPLHQLALHPVQLERQRRRDGARAADRRRPRRGSAVLGDHRSSGRQLLPPVCAAARRTPSAFATKCGTTATWATPFPARRRGPRSTCARCCPDLPLRRPDRAPLTREDAKCSNLSSAPVPRAGHARAAAGPSRRAVDRPTTARCINRDHARAWLPGDLAPGGAATSRSKSRRPRHRAATR